MLTEESAALEKLENKIKSVVETLAVNTLKQEVAEKEKATHEPSFWEDSKKAESVMAELKRLRLVYEPWESLTEKAEEAKVLLELADEEGEGSLLEELKETLLLLEKEFDNQKTLLQLGEPTDKMGAFLTIHSGAGGVEACDWAAMLYRMYLRWCESRNFSLQILEINESEGGIKSVTLSVTGDYAFGLLKGEGGIHRLVRISPFDSNSRRHTSFASVYVSPVIDDTITVDIKPEEIRVDTYRAGGAGGQHINKTDSAVRITHLETGLTVQCQNERSQLKNRELALNMLKSRLYEYLKQRQEEEQSKQAAEKKEIGWGSQIRSYVFHPYTMVKDLRTRHETGNIQAVMDGELTPFIEAWLNYRQG